jgi:hypothetical protein
VKLDKTDIAYAEKADQERLARPDFRLYFNRMGCLDMAIASELYERFTKPDTLHAANAWWENLSI